MCSSGSGTRRPFIIARTSGFAVRTLPRTLNLPISLHLYFNGSRTVSNAAPKEQWQTALSFAKISLHRTSKDISEDRKLKTTYVYQTWSTYGSRRTRKWRSSHSIASFAVRLFLPGQIARNMSPAIFKERCVSRPGGQKGNICLAPE
jgi:hypothetical protein